MRFSKRVHKCGSSSSLTVPLDWLDKRYLGVSSLSPHSPTSTHNTRATPSSLTNNETIRSRAGYVGLGRRYLIYDRYVLSCVFLIFYCHYNIANTAELIKKLINILVTPSLAFYIKSLGGSQDFYGFVLAIYSFCSFLGKPILGRWRCVIQHRISLWRLQ